MDAEAARAAAAAIVGLLVGGTFGIALHEAGHAGAAWLVGFEPRLITIGHGKILLRFRLGRLWIVMRALPLYGIAARLPDPAGRAGAQAFVAAGGPLASLAFLAVIVAVLRVRFHDASIEEIEALIGVGGAGFGQASASLFPMTSRFAGRRRPTDGLKLWRIARRGEIDNFRARYAKLVHPNLAAVDIVPNPSIQAPEMLYQLGRSDLKDEWAQADFAAVLTGLLDGDKLNAQERRFLIDRLGLGAFYAA